MQGAWLNIFFSLLFVSGSPLEETADFPGGFSAPPHVWLDEGEVEPVIETLVPYSIPDQATLPVQEECWVWKVMPDGLLYRSYAASVHEPRFASVYLHDSERGWYWDNTLGGRVGVVRYGTTESVGASGWQLDMEGAVFTRLRPSEKDDLDSADFRFGVPITWSDGTTAVKFGYKHISSHLGDEFLIKNPGYPRVNYVRDGLLLGVSHYLEPELRLYGEAGWAYSVDGGAKPWEFQFGAEYTRPACDDRRLVPFAAINSHLRQEFNYGGSLNIVAGWQWLGRDSGRAYRFGMQYYRGKSSQFSFYEQRDRMLGGGMWFEY